MFQKNPHRGKEGREEVELTFKSYRSNSSRVTSQNYSSRKAKECKQITTAKGKEDKFWAVIYICMLNKTRLKTTMQECQLRTMKIVDRLPGGRACPDLLQSALQWNRRSKHSGIEIIASCSFAGESLIWFRVGSFSHGLCNSESLAEWINEVTPRTKQNDLKGPDNGFDLSDGIN